MAFSIQGISSITGVSSLDFGEGGTPPGGGGGGGTVVFDAIGDGGQVDNSSVTNIPWSHTAAADSYVIAVVEWSSSYSAPSSVTYGGDTMTLLGGDTLSSTSMNFYGIVDSTGGTKSVDIPSSSSMRYAAVNSISYTGVTSVGSVVSQTSTSPVSQSVSCSTGNMIVQAFGIYGSTHSPSGGTNRYYHDIRSGARGSMSISDSSTTETFDATGSGSFVSLAVVLS